MEWLVYHRSIGFQHVYLYCNDDDPSELYDRLCGFLNEAEPFLTFVHYPFQGLQWEIYLHWFRNYGDETDWIAFLDADEFLALPGLDNIGRFIQRYPKDADAVHFHWLYYGTSDFLTRPIGSVLRQYTRRAPQVSAETKTIVRAHRIDSSRLKPNQLPFWHLWDRMHQDSITVYATLGENVTAGFHRATYVRDHDGEIRSTAFVAHFALRSEADFRRRLARGTSGQFYGQGMWAKNIASGEAYGYMDHTNAVTDTYLSEYWTKLVGTPRSTKFIPDVPGRNLAASRKCIQSSVGKGTEQAVSNKAASIVSGIVTGRPSFMTLEELRPWWQVDLGETRLVEQIRVFNRVDDLHAAARHNPLLIHSSEVGETWQERYRRDDAAPFGGADGNPLIWTAPEAFSARYVRLSVDDTCSLGLDQVEVYGPICASRKISVVSFFMENIPQGIVRSQRAIISKFLPEGFDFKQIMTDKSHYESLDDYMASSLDDATIFLDIDCIPLHSSALLELASAALQNELAGCVQRASHIDNNQHLYVGPFCMSLTTRLWHSLGRPSFRPTAVGDVGEQLTYECEERGIRTRFIWPTFVEQELWPLVEGVSFGHNTVYGDAFFHAFSIRSDSTRSAFLEYCSEVSREPPRKGQACGGAMALKRSARLVWNLEQKAEWPSKAMCSP